MGLARRRWWTAALCVVGDNTYAATDPRAKLVTLVAQRTPDGRGMQWEEKTGAAGADPASSRVWGTAMLHERPPSDPAKLKALVDDALHGRSDKETRAIIGFGIEGAIGGGSAGGGGGASAVKDPKAGGVWVSFDPGSFDGERDEASLAAFTDALRRVGGGEASGAVVLPPAERREELMLVPMASLVAPWARTVGRLTRVRGYVKTAAGALYVVGVLEPGAEPIDLDVLVVALQAVWRDGDVPFVSLDPAPGNPMGDPVSRIGGVPEGAKDSAFLRILLAADYRMKEILLGSREVKEPGVSSLASLLKERNPPVREVMNRFWLAPLSALGADVLETKRGEATAVWFQSRAQVLTEQMLEGPSALGATGDGDPIAREVAERMTAAWPRLWAEVPVFRRASTAFDCAKLCTLLRIRGEKAAVLAELAAREIAHGRAGPQDEPVPPFKAVGPTEVTGTPHMVFGGARAKARFLAGDREGARARLDVAVAADADDAEMRYWRALVRMTLHREAEAIDDLGHAVAATPRARALRGHLLAQRGDRAAAEADLDGVEREASGDANVRGMTVLGWMELGDMARADVAVRALRALAPFEKRTQALEAIVRRARRMSPEEAARERRWRREVPAELQGLFAVGEAMRAQHGDESVAAWAEALATVEASTVPAVRELEVAEKLRLVIVFSGSKAARLPDVPAEARAEMATKLRGHADASAAAHPERPTPRLLQAIAAAVATDADPAEIGRLYGEAVARKGAPDPFLRDLGELLDTESPLEVLGFSIAWSFWEAGKDAKPVLEALIALLGARTPAGSLRALLAHPGFNLATWSPSLDPRSRGEDREATQAAIAALRAADAAIPETPLEGGVAVWFAPVLYKSAVLGEQSSGDKARMKAAALKFLRLSTVPTVPSMLREEYADARAHMVPLVMGETFRTAFDGVGEKMEAPGKRLSEAVKSKDAAEIRAAMPAVTAGVEELRGRVRVEVGKVLAQLEAACGPRIAAAAELFAHATQAKLRGNMDKPEKELDQLRAIPGLAGSKELASFEAAFRAMATGLMIDGTPEAALERVRRPPNDELAAQTLERLIPVLRDLLRGMSDTEAPSPAEIELGRLEAELKMRIAGGVYGLAVGAVPGAPAKPGSPVDGPRPQGGGVLPPAPPTSSGPSSVPSSGSMPWMWIVGGLAAVGAWIVVSQRR